MNDSVEGQIIANERLDVGEQKNDSPFKDKNIANDLSFENNAGNEGSFLLFSLKNNLFEESRAKN